MWLSTKKSEFPFISHIFLTASNSQLDNFIAFRTIILKTDLFFVFHVLSPFFRYTNFRTSSLGKKNTFHINVLSVTSKWCQLLKLQSGMHLLRFLGLVPYITDRQNCIETISNETPIMHKYDLILKIFLMKRQCCTYFVPNGVIVSKNPMAIL